MIARRLFSYVGIQFFWVLGWIGRLDVIAKRNQLVTPIIVEL
jgi:hypothetical protein